MREIVPARKEKIRSITCDCCKTKYTDIMEIQEFLSFRDTAGYGSTTVGDMTSWSIDLCQTCTARLLGKYIRVNHP